MLEFLNVDICTNLAITSPKKLAKSTGVKISTFLEKNEGVWNGSMDHEMDFFDVT